MRTFLISILSLLLITTSTLANYQYGIFSETTVAHTSFDLHLEPDTLSAIQHSILPGEKITIISKTDYPFEANNFTTDWYKISCSTSDGIVTGYSPSIYFSLTHETLSSGDIFAFGITGYNVETNRFDGSGRIISEGVILAETEVPPPADSWGSSSSFIYNVDSHLQSSQGYSEVTDIPLIEFTYEACGYENRDIPVFWTGEVLVSAQYTSSVFEAGCFHWLESHIFASDTLGQQNTLIIHALSEIWNDELGDGEYVISSETDQFFLWTGSDFQTIEDYPTGDIDL